MSDLPQHRTIRTIQFADDTSIFITYSDVGMAINLLNIYLVDLVNFFKKWRLVLNADKTNMLHIQGSTRDTNRSLRSRARRMLVSIEGHLIRHSVAVKLLGVTFQTNARFHKHIQSKLESARRAKFRLIRLLRSKIISADIKIGLYKTFIRPILAYGSPIRLRPGSISSCLMESIRVLERAAVRAIYLWYTVLDNDILPLEAFFLILPHL